MHPPSSICVHSQAGLIGIFPGRGRVVWCDWYTHDVVHAAVGTNTTLSAPLGHINVHVRDGSAILLHAQPAYTVAETRQGPYSLLVSLTTDGYAFGTAYIDDGESLPPTPNTTVTFTAKKNELYIIAHGSFDVTQKLDTITVLGVGQNIPTSVTLQSKQHVDWEFSREKNRLSITGLDLDINANTTISWN